MSTTTRTKAPHYDKLYYHMQGADTHAAAGNLPHAWYHMHQARLTIAALRAKTIDREVPHYGTRILIADELSPGDVPF